MPEAIVSYYHCLLGLQVMLLTSYFTSSSSSVAFITSLPFVIIIMLKSIESMDYSNSKASGSFVITSLPFAAGSYYHPC